MGVTGRGWVAGNGVSRSSNSTKAGRRPTPLGSRFSEGGGTAVTANSMLVKYFSNSILCLTGGGPDFGGRLVTWVCDENRTTNRFRVNRQKSQGPVTPMGKDRIRSNALKNGLTARLTLWANEDSGQFQALLVALLERFAPANDVEFLCVEEMAMAKWRLRRVVSLETAEGNKHLAETTATGGAGTLAAFSAAQQAEQLLTTLRQHEAASPNCGAMYVGGGREWLRRGGEELIKTTGVSCAVDRDKSD